MRDPIKHKEARRARFATGNRQPGEMPERSAERNRRWRANQDPEARERRLAAMRELLGQTVVCPTCGNEMRYGSLNRHRRSQHGWEPGR